MNTETPHKVEIVDVICDHAGPCPPRGRGCRWIQFERECTSCECGGWDERWVSRDMNIWLAGRTHHRRSCASTSPVERTCPTCHAGLDTATHHAACVAPLDQLDGGAA